MLWQQIIGQERATEILTQSMLHNRVSQAYLFYGQEGIGKQAVAMECAAALQMSADELETLIQTPTSELPRGYAKGLKLLHPDIHVFFPTTKDYDFDDYNARLDLLRQNPYTHVDYARLASVNGSATKSGKQAFYSVDRINEELKPKVQYKPTEGRYQVVVILEAHLFRTEAANAFLKVLEEPTESTIFILTSSRPEKMLPTLVSRCQRLRFDPLPESQVAEALARQFGLSPEQSMLFARMGEGSYNKALAFSNNPDMIQLREMVVAFLRFAFTQNINQQNDLIEKLAKMGRETLKTYFRLMLLWMHDVLLVQTTQNTNAIINLDMAETMFKFANAIKNAQPETMVNLIEEAFELVERNVSENLILLSLHGSIHLAMKGKRVSLYNSLTL